MSHPEMPSSLLTPENTDSASHVLTQDLYRDCIAREVCPGCFVAEGREKKVSCADADANRGCCRFSCYEDNIKGNDDILPYQSTKAMISFERNQQQENTGEKIVEMPSQGDARDSKDDSLQKAA